MRVDEAKFEVYSETGRYEVTSTTGNMDVDTLKTLREPINERNCSVYACPVTSGRIAPGHPVELL